MRLIRNHTKFFSKVALFETFIAVSADDIVFAQMFDIPAYKQDDIKSQETSKKEGLTLEQQFNTYHYSNIGYSDVTDEHGVKVYTSGEIKRMLVPTSRRASNNLPNSVRFVTFEYQWSAGNRLVR